MPVMNMTRRSFTKATALVAATAALGGSVAAADSLVNSTTAYAEDEEKLVHTSCRACISNCGVIAHVKNGRVVKLEGDPADPMSQGRLCPKGLSGIQALYHPNRNKYPMKRVGERGGNEWERISWDEAIDTIADALMEMYEKTGPEGLLLSTGGGGNPQFFSPPRFRNFFGAGNVFEPGCAQCYLPRNFTMPLINGASDTSIADSNCAALYNPTAQIDSYVMWGTGPAQHAPSSAGRAIVELREQGVQTVVIDPRFTPDAARADVWLPVRPGTDVAMMMGWIRYVIDNKLYDEEFCTKWSNLPFLVDPDDPAGALLRASKVFDDVTADNEGYVYYDEGTGKVTKAYALTPDNEASYKPALFGTYDVTLADGSTVSCQTAFEAYKAQVDEFTLERVAQICNVEAEDLEKAIHIYADVESSGITLGVATDQYPQSTQAAIGAAALDCMMGYINKPGSPAHGGFPHAAESTVFPTGFMGEAPYEFQTPENIEKRLGYVEHKGLGGWMHSHIPTILNAILTGEPYQPHIWIERSGNKMAMLGNSASWVDAFPKLDLIVHMYMYPTSFSTEAADLLLPTAEWLETAFVQGRLYTVLLRQPVTNLFECIDETFIWAKHAKALADRGHEGMQKAFDPEACGSTPTYWNSMEEYYEFVASNVQMSWDELKEKAPFNQMEPEAYWEMANSAPHLALGEDGSYTGFGRCAAKDIKDNPKKCGPYGDTMIYLGRHGNEAFEMPAASEEYLPMPYYHEPDDNLEYGEDYPLILTEGRIPFYHHGTLRNNPYLRELYPAPEVWIGPEDAEAYGIEDGAWVNVHSPRTDGLDVFCDLNTGEPLTAEGQAIVSGGIYGVAKVTEGIAKGSVYMERFWNPEFLEEGQDPRKSWTLCNMNVLTKNTGYFNPEFGTYTLRGINVKITPAERPEGIWYEPSDFAAWLPQASENTGGGAA